MAEISYPMLDHLRLLTVRSFMMTLRDPWLFWVRLVSVTNLPILLGLIYKTEVGDATGCFPSVSENLTYDEYAEFQDRMRKETTQAGANLGLVLYSVLFIMFSGLMPTVITFPLEMAAFVKEKTNNWYTVTNYFMGKSLAEIPFQLVFVFLFIIMSYFWNGEPNEAWRFFTYLFIQILTGFIGQSHGMLVGALLMKDIAAAVYIAPITTFPIMLLSGFFVKMENVDLFWERAAYVSYLRHAFEASIVTLFGMERCGSPEDVEDNADKFGSGLSDLLFDIIHSTCGREESHILLHFANGTHYQPGKTPEMAEAAGKFIDSMVLHTGKDFIDENGEIRSSIMTSFSLIDGDLYRSLGCLFGYMIILRLVAYAAVYLKANQKD
ncbi:ATP-binding cassette sub-family G member 4 [Halotydeus destructor]|nr:ATP-binding cassette sub-family G member 4 [Halotydeus destructor]